MKAELQSICFELTPALIAFRRTAGDANRHLNTMLVAIETLKSATPVRPPGLVVPWTKPGVKKEWDDSRDFALKGAMIAVVDGLDQYMRVLSRRAHTTQGDRERAEGASSSLTSIVPAVPTLG